MKKKLLLIPLVLLLAISLVGIGCANPTPTPAETFHLSFSCSRPAPPVGTPGIAYEAFLDKIEERSNGRIQVDERFWGGALATAAETIDLVGDGGVDIGETTYGIRPSAFPLWDMERVFMFGPMDPHIYVPAMWQMCDEFPEFERDEAAMNLKRVSIIPWGYYNLLSFEPMVTLADFKGKTIGTWGVISPKYFEVIGAGAMSTPATERYMLLKQHVLDAETMSCQADVDFKLYEVAKHYTILEQCGVVPMTVSFNLDVFNSLPPDLQEMVLDTGREVSLAHSDTLVKSREDSFKVLKDAGVVFHEMSEADKTEWSGMVTDLPRWWADDKEAMGYPAYEILNRWVDVTEELGHKWLTDWHPLLVK